LNIQSVLGLSLLQLSLEPVVNECKCYETVSLKILFVEGSV
jgi:hypothetical protein